MLVNIRTRPDSGPDGVEFIFDETVDYSSRKFRGQANPNNLTTRRWREPILSAAEVAAYLRAVHDGAEPAASAANDKLVLSFHRLVLKESKPFCDGVNNEDIIAAGMKGFVEARSRFDLRRNNGLTAYALPYIRGAMQTAAKAIKRNGFAGETRLQRLVHGDHDATPERASEVMGRPVDADELEAATAQAIGMCSEVIAYDTREPAFENEYDEESKPGIIAIAPLSPLQRIHKHHSELVEWYAEDTDRRARKRLKEIGRRAYALELVERDHARKAGLTFFVAARAEPTQYLYRTDTPLYVRAGIASQIDRPTPHNSARRYADRSFSSGPHSVNGLLKKKHSKKRRPRIRVWRCNEPAALAA
jgi:hypothetical protein